MTSQDLLNADLLRQSGNLAEAYFIYRDKLKTLQKVGDKFWEAKTLLGIGVIMQDLGELRSEESEAINKRISSELKADDDWRFFKLRFEKVHPAFFESLQQAFPSLSRTELRLCAYIKVGMSAKEIAQIMSVMPPSINTARYRIRKKMGLDSEDSLEAALDKF